jgi:hypothetical protein
MKKRTYLFALLLVCFATLGSAAISAQTSVFTYQGKLTDSGISPNAPYDFTFRLFDSASGGVQVGSDKVITGVQVTAGIFTVNLDFGASFPGANRWLEISIKPAGTPGGYQQLLPRQPLTSTPYAIRSANSTLADTATLANTATDSTQLGGVPADQYVQTTDSRMTDGRNPLPGSPSYVQVNPLSAQSADFNIAGNGNATVFDASIQYNIGGSRLLSVPGTNNIFAGLGSGTSNTTGARNAFFGKSAGFVNTQGTDNSFFGYQAGLSNITGNLNSFFGSNAGLHTTVGDQNAFFGESAGQGNTTGNNNAFFGRGAGFNSNADGNAFFGFSSGSANLAGTGNSFFGFNSGLANQGGAGNTFVGRSSGGTNVSGGRNTLIGDSANVGASNLSNASAIGALSFVATSNSLVLGSINGINGSTADTNVGIGTTSPGARLHVKGTGIVRTLVDSDSNAGFQVALNGSPKWTVATGTGNQFQVFNESLLQNAVWINQTNNNIGFGTTTPAEKVDIAVNSGHILLGDPGCLSGYTAIGFGTSLAGCSNYSMVGNGTDTIINRPNGGAISFREANSTQMSIASGGAVTVNGTLAVFNISAPGSIPLCYDGITSKLAQCSSSLRYKTNLAPYRSGLDIVSRLQPITFDWKSGGMHDLGFGAEDVAKVEPLLTTRNKKGEIEGVKYDRISAVLVNAVKEQQAQIEEQEKQIEEQARLLEKQQKQIDVLNQVVASRRRPHRLTKKHGGKR